MLHKGCCGSLHGNGVRKEKPDPLPTVKKKCSLDSSCSDDSAWEYASGILPAVFRVKRMAVRSQSSDCAVERRHRLAETETSLAVNTLPRRASSAVVSQRLYSTPTRAVAAKFRVSGQQPAADSRPSTPAGVATAAADPTGDQQLQQQSQQVAKRSAHTTGQCYSLMNLRFILCSLAEFMYTV